VQFEDHSLFNVTRNGQQLSVAASTIKNCRETIRQYKITQGSPNKYVFTTLRTEHHWRELRRETQSIPSLLQCLEFETRKLQNSIIDRQLYELFNKNEVEVLTEEEENLMNDLLDRIGHSVRQKSARTPSAPCGTLPQNIRYLDRELPWVTRDTVLIIKSITGLILCRVATAIYTSDIMAHIELYEAEYHRDAIRSYRLNGIFLTLHHQVLEFFDLQIQPQKFLEFTEQSYHTIVHEQYKLPIILKPTEESDDDEEPGIIRE